MKRFLILLMMIFTTDSLASGIASNSNTAPCTNTTLETYSGNSNLSADWQPNEIQLRWYNNNTLMDVQTNANTCTYDDVLNVPSTAPSRVGYTFDGWTVRPEINFATTIPKNVNGIERWAIGWSDNANYCFYNTDTGAAWNVDCNSDATYINELQTHEWKVRYEHGDLYGMAGCSTTCSVWAASGNPAIGIGQCCWCKATGYKATNTSVVNGPTLALSWVFYLDVGSSVSCAQRCATLCSAIVARESGFRTALFTPASN